MSDDELLDPPVDEDPKAAEPSASEEAEQGEEPVAESKSEAKPADETDAGTVEAKLVQPSRRKRWPIIAGALGGLLVIGLGLFFYDSSVRSEESEKFNSARQAGTEEGWREYIDWVAALRNDGGLAFSWAKSRTPIERHERLAMTYELDAQADTAIAAEDWPALCALRQEHEGSSAARKASGALRERFDNAIRAFRDKVGPLRTPQSVVDKIVHSMRAQRDADVCAGKAVVELEVNVTGTTTVEGRQLNEVLSGLITEERRAALLETLVGNVETLFGGVLEVTPSDGAQSPDDGALHMLTQVSFLGFERFVMPDRTELPGVAMDVQVVVAATGAPTPQRPDYSSARFTLPADFALQVFQEAEAGVDAIYAHMLDLLLPRAADRAGQILAVTRYQPGSTFSGYGPCAHPEPLVPGRMVRGNTRRDGSDTYAGSCGEPYPEEDYDDYGADGSYDIGRPEIAYRVVVPERSILVANMEPEFDGMTYIRSDCRSSTAEVACDETGHARAIVDEGVYYVFVDGTTDEEGGPFRMVTNVHPLDDVEQACAGVSRTLTPGEAVTGTTARGTNILDGSCGGAALKEQLYKLEIESRSRVRCSVTGPVGHTLYIRSDCTDLEAELGCLNATPSQTKELTVLAEPGSYIVAVDGYALGDNGDYSLTCDVQPEDSVEGGVGDSCDNPVAIDTTQETQIVPVDTFRLTDALSSTCGGAGSPDQVFRLDLEHNTRLRTSWARGSHLRGYFHLKRGCGQDDPMIGCSGRAGNLLWDLEPGTYYLAVDDRAHDEFGSGSFNLSLFDTDNYCTERPVLQGGHTQGTIRSGSIHSNFDGSCGGRGSAENVYVLRIVRRSRVVMGLTSERPALYLRRACGDKDSEVSCAQSTSRTQPATIDTVLAPGDYYVFVDSDGYTTNVSFDLETTISRLDQAPE